MDKTHPAKTHTVIIGAGFSRAMGFPLQEQLLTKILADDFRERVSIESAPLVHDVVKFLRAVYGNQTIEEQILLEDVYSSIDSAIAAERNLGTYTPQKLLEIKTSLNSLILILLTEQMSHDIDPSPFHSLMSQIIQENVQVTFISMNWDWLLEMLLKQDYEYDIHFGDTIPIVMKNGTDTDSNQKPITVLKPHGSIDWRLCPACERLFRVDSQSLEYETCIYCFSDKKSEEILQESTGQNTQQSTEIPILFESDEDRQILSKRSVALQPIIVTPTFHKHKFIGSFQSIQTEVLHAIQNAHKITFIGYSLPVSDIDIRDIFLRAVSLRNNPPAVKIIQKEKEKDHRRQLMKNFSTIFHNINENDFFWKGLESAASFLSSIKFR